MSKNTEIIDGLSEELQEVYGFVKSNAPKMVNATQVGIVVGRKTSSQASAWGHYRLKQLIEEGLLEKDEDTKKYGLASSNGEETSEEPVKANKKEEKAPKPEKKADKKADKKDKKADDEKADETPAYMENTEDELVANKTLVEFKPHHLSQEAKDGKKVVRGMVTKVFFEDDGRRFAQVKIDGTGKRCFKRDRFLTVTGEVEVSDEEE